jgi:hypothetical protein
MQKNIYESTTKYFLHIDENHHLKMVLSGYIPTKHSFHRPLGRILLYCRIRDQYFCHSLSTNDSP